MPRIFDNIDEDLSQALQHSPSKAKRTDFCAGYYNLRGCMEAVQETITKPDTRLSRGFGGQVKYRMGKELQEDEG